MLALKNSNIDNL